MHLSDPLDFIHPGLESQMDVFSKSDILMGFFCCAATSYVYGWMSVQEHLHFSAWPPGLSCPLAQHGGMPCSLQMPRIKIYNANLEHAHTSTHTHTHNYGISPSTLLLLVSVTQNSLLALSSEQMKMMTGQTDGQKETKQMGGQRGFYHLSWNFQFVFMFLSFVLISFFEQAQDRRFGR